VGSAYALVALGFSVTFTTTKTLNFSHGEFVSAGAFVGMSVLFLAIGKPLTSTIVRRRRPRRAGAAGALLARWGDGR
jgi:branched-chain amino acid transport system permease protein